MEYHFCWSLKISSFEFFWDEKYSILWAKKLIENWYLLLKGFCFDLFVNGKYGLFLCQKVGGKMIFTDYWKFLFWTLWWWEIQSFLSQKVDRKMIFTGYWEVLLFNFSVRGNMVFFFSQNGDGKITFTWSFWAFHDILGLGKYGFSYNVWFNWYRN